MKCIYPLEAVIYYTLYITYRSVIAIMFIHVTTMTWKGAGEKISYLLAFLLFLIRKTYDQTV